MINNFKKGIVVTVPKKEIKIKCEKHKILNHTYHTSKVLSRVGNQRIG